MYTCNTRRLRENVRDPSAETIAAHAYYYYYYYILHICIYTHASHRALVRISFVLPAAARAIYLGTDLLLLLLFRCFLFLFFLFIICLVVLVLRAGKQKVYPDDAVATRETCVHVYASERARGSGIYWERSGFFFFLLCGAVHRWEKYTRARTYNPTYTRRRRRNLSAALFLYGCYVHSTVVVVVASDDAAARYTSRPRGLRRSRCTHTHARTPAQSHVQCVSRRIRKKKWKKKITFLDTAAAAVRGGNWSGVKIYILLCTAHYI